MNTQIIASDFLIIGSGAAGLHAALHACQYGSVTLLTKSKLTTSSSYWAQGGIAAVLTKADSFKSHKEDTLQAGRKYCNTTAVDLLVKEGAECVQDLISTGMPFDRQNGSFHLGLEGGHSNRRVLHANGAATGKALIEFLTQKVRQEPAIKVIEQAFVYQLLTKDKQCVGAGAYQYKQGKELKIKSPTTILATGGYSGLYNRSTNPHTSTGDGLWLAYNAGAELQDLEFVQFHPTAFYDDKDGSGFLISEALRGEGARLYNQAGERFMEGYHQKELEPRDVVAQQIHAQIGQQELDYVFLDVTHLSVGNLSNHFPHLISRIENQGIDIEREGIPVAPAAHYCIGGVSTDLHGATAVDGLYACGEVAATGVHGANRLASNSILECLVFSKRAVRHATSQNQDLYASDVAHSFRIDEQNRDAFSRIKDTVSTLLSTGAGINRNSTEMTKALQKLEKLKQNLFSDEKEYYGIRARGVLRIAEFICRSADEREESRGVHRRSDFEDRDDNVEHSCFQKESTLTI